VVIGALLAAAVEGWEAWLVELSIEIRHHAMGNEVKIVG
jgi:hypothetical protein